MTSAWPAASATTTTTLGEIKDLTYGLGLNWGSLTLDYGSVPQATTLPHVEKISLGYRF